MVRGNTFGFIIYLIVSLYFLNSAFGFVTMPAAILGVQNIILGVGGGLLLFAGIKYLTHKKMPGIR